MTDIGNGVDRKLSQWEPPEVIALPGLSVDRCLLADCGRKEIIHPDVLFLPVHDVNKSKFFWLNGHADFLKYLPGYALCESLSLLYMSGR